MSLLVWPLNLYIVLFERSSLSRCGQILLAALDGHLGSKIDSAQLLHELVLRSHLRVLARCDGLLVEEVLDLRNRRKVDIVAQMAEQG